MSKNLILIQFEWISYCDIVSLITDQVLLETVKRLNYSLPQLINHYAHKCARCTVYSFVVVVIKGWGIGWKTTACNRYLVLECIKYALLVWQKMWFWYWFRSAKMEIVGPCKIDEFSVIMTKYVSCKCIQFNRSRCVSFLVYKRRLHQSRE